MANTNVHPTPEFPVKMEQKLDVDRWPDEIKQIAETPPQAPDREYPEPSRWERVQLNLPRLTYPIRYLLQKLKLTPRPSPESLEPFEPVPPMAEADLLKAAAQIELAGIALSGGGIRSATFGLGVLQALAEMDVLRRFDYVSSVSGGGYLNSWLAAWVKRRGYELADDALGSDADGLGIHDRWSIQQPIHFLRRYSNYLTPRVDLFGGDQWAAVAIFVRNLLLNLATLVCWLVAALLMPHFVIRFADWLQQHEWFASFLLPVIFALGVLPIRVLARSLAILDSRFATTPDCPDNLDQRAVNRMVLLPTFLGGLAATSLLYVNRLQPGAGYWSTIGVWSSVTAVAHAVLWYLVDLSRPSQLKFGSLSLSRTALLSSSVISGAVSGILWALLSTSMSPELKVAVWLGPPAVMGILLIGSTIHLGLLGIAFDDTKREWLARAAGLLALYSLAWFGVYALTIFLPPVVVKAYQDAMGGGLKKVVTLAGSLGITLGWLITTIVGLLAAASEKTAALANADAAPAKANHRSSNAWRRLVANSAPYVFVGGLLLLLSLLVHLGLARLQGASSMSFLVSDPWRVALLIAIVASLAWILTWRVDVNEFSMHLFYRNRLVRCYLGATNRQRRAHRFTGFDVNDDLPLYQLSTGVNEGPFQGPYPIINATLNLTGGADLAFQKRKAANFIFSPLFCGYERSRTGDRPPLHFNAYRRSRNYACGELKRRRAGLELGTVLAISGAAASPNMGYYSSKPTAFLMTLANVRLGWWMGNPRRNDRWQRQGPRFGLKYLMAELLGTANDKRGHVYISDGGHFENLGLYELVRRRCRFILVCDGTRDQAYGFDGLAAAIEKCRVDFGASIEIDLQPLTPQPDNQGLCPSHFAVGTIGYGAGQKGTLLYLKLSRAGDEPVDIRSYARKFTAFPHDSTADQWFDEDQFEAYRTLGQHVAASAFISALVDPNANRHNSELCDALTEVFGFAARAGAAAGATAV